MPAEHCLVLGDGGGPCGGAAVSLQRASKRGAAGGAHTPGDECGRRHAAVSLPHRHPLPPRRVRILWAQAFPRSGMRLLNAALRKTAHTLVPFPGIMLDVESLYGFVQSQHVSEPAPSYHSPCDGLLLARLQRKLLPSSAAHATVCEQPSRIAARMTWNVGFHLKDSIRCIWISARQN